MAGTQHAEQRPLPIVETRARLAGQGEAMTEVPENEKETVPALE